MSTGTWSVEQYERFADVRARPFFELLARVPSALEPVRIADLGCGSGSLTQTLADRFPAALIEGVDSSEAMLEAARKRERPGHLTFRRGTLEGWRPEAPVDLLVSNAALHWASDHPALLTAWSHALSPRGVLAFQVPANFAAPSHRELYALCDSPRWSPKLGNVARGAVLTLEAYVRHLHSLHLEVDAWQTTYVHVLAGEAPVLEWMKGTTLRPMLAVLTQEEQAAFLHEYGERLDASYLRIEDRVLFPFTRRFIVAQATARGR